MTYFRGTFFKRLQLGPRMNFLGIFWAQNNGVVVGYLTGTEIFEFWTFWTFSLLKMIVLSDGHINIWLLALFLPVAADQIGYP